MLLIRKKSDRGFTLVEVLIGIGVSLFLFASLVAAFLGVKSINLFAKHHIQAMQVVRGQVELLKATAFSVIGSAADGYTGSPLVKTTGNFSYDAGVDGVFGTADDLRGIVAIQVRDALDMDGDGNTTEDYIDIDGDAANDAIARPIRVMFTWTQNIAGRNKTFSVFADTLIAA